MRAYIMFLLAAALLAVAGCSTQPCREGTVCVEVQFDAVTETADQLKVLGAINSIDAPAYLVEYNHAVAGNNRVDFTGFPGGYQAGEVLHVRAFALKGGSALGTGDAQITLLPSYTTATLSLVGFIPDGGLPDLTKQTDGGTPDLAHATSDLASDDGPPPDLATTDDGANQDASDDGPPPPPPDMTNPADGSDGSVLSDSAVTNDLAKPVDASDGAMPFDSAVIADLVKPDLLPPPDLIPPPDLTPPPDLLPPPDLYVAPDLAPMCTPTGNNCGGDCVMKCPNGEKCKSYSDCASGSCLNNGSNVLTCSPTGYSWVLVTNVGNATGLDCLVNGKDNYLPLPQTGVWTLVGPYDQCYFVSVQNNVLHYATGVQGSFTEWQVLGQNGVNPICQALNGNNLIIGFAQRHVANLPCN